MSVDLKVIRCFDESSEVKGSSNAVLAYAWRDMGGKVHEGEMFLSYSYKRGDSEMPPNYKLYTMECKNKATGPLADIVERHFRSANPQVALFYSSTHEEAFSRCVKLREEDMWDIDRKGRWILVPPYHLIGSLSEPGWKAYLGRGRFDLSFSTIARTRFTVTELSTGR